MSGSAQFLEDAIAASNRAVHFDRCGGQEAAASYFYKVAASQLEKAAQLLSNGDKQNKLLSKAKEYCDRAAILLTIENKRLSLTVTRNHSKGKEMLEKVYFLFEQGLEADEADFTDKAIEFYTEAVELALKYTPDDQEIKNDPEIKAKTMKVALKALERAEQLKGIEPRTTKSSISPSNTQNFAGIEPRIPERGGIEPWTTKTNSYPSNTQKPTSKGVRGGEFAGVEPPATNLKVSGQSTYSPEEKQVLLHTSKVNKNEFVPFMDIDLSERFQYAIPFTDKDGFLALSPKQIKEFGGWVRPGDICGEPCVVLGEHPDYFR